MSCYTGKCEICPKPCDNSECPWKTNDTGKWNALKKEFLDYKIDGTMYRTKKTEDDTWEFVKFDDGLRGCQMNILSLRLSWEMEGWYECRKMRRSKKRKMRKLVKRRLKRLTERYK